MMSQKSFTILRTPEEMQFWNAAQRTDGKTIGFVPTMGALHDGHLSLVRKALEHCDTVVASIFVNPTQFAPHEDFDSYPRAEDADIEKLISAGCAAAFCPSARIMYPEGDSTRVYVEGLSSILEGEHRPHFFGGVANIVARLFIRVAPDIAIFGEKDYQQLLIIKRMTKDLGLPIDVIGAPTIREADGLAMSSRNAYLSPTDREKAGGFAAALRDAAADIRAGGSILAATDKANLAIEKAGLGPIDYVAVRHAETLAPLNGDMLHDQPARILAAAWMGKTRLIDNLPL